MSQQQIPSGAGEPFPEVPPIKVHSASVPCVSSSAVTGGTPTAGAARKIAIAVDLSDESAYAVKWAVDHYLRPGDAVVLVHVRPTSIGFGADWGSAHLSAASVGIGGSEESQKKLEDDFDAFTTSKAADLARPLIDAQIPYKIHIVKDHDMKERLCLEIERLKFDAVVMGSRGFGATRRETNDRLGSVSDYCLRTCSSPVVVVRCSGDKDGNGVDNAIVKVSEAEEE